MVGQRRERGGGGGGGGGGVGQRREREGGLCSWRCWCCRRTVLRSSEYEMGGEREEEEGKLCTGKYIPYTGKFWRPLNLAPMDTENFCPQQ